MIEVCSHRILIKFNEPAKISSIFVKNGEEKYYFSKALNYDFLNFNQNSLIFLKKQKIKKEYQFCTDNFILFMLNFRK